MREKFKVVGLRRFHYKSKKSVAEYDAVNLFCTCERDGVNGLATENFFLRADVLGSGVDVGSDCHVFYNRFGSVDAVVKA